MAKRHSDALSMTKECASVKGGGNKVNDLGSVIRLRCCHGKEESLHFSNGIRLWKTLLFLLCVLSFLFAGKHCIAAIPGVDALTGATVNEKTINGKQHLTIGLLDTLINPLDVLTLTETVQRIEKALPNYSWNTVSITAAEARDEIERRKPDFLFAPAGFPLFTNNIPGWTSFRIATRKTSIAPDVNHATGAVFVVLDNRQDLSTLSSLEGKTAITNLPTAVDGWLAAAGEIAKLKKNPEVFFSSVRFRNNSYPDAISSVLAGKSDVAIIPACLLETLQEMNLAQTQWLRVVNEKKNDGFACRHSSDLYPDISLYALSTAPEKAVRDVTIAILSLSEQKADNNTLQTEWLTNSSDSSVDQLLHRLQLGPYQYLRDTSVSAFFSRHRTIILSSIGILLFLVLNEFRLVSLVRRRTRLLRQALQDRNHWEAQAESVRRSLMRLERRSALEQMSGMIAHEVNAPVGTIRTYVELIRMLVRSGAISENATAKTALDGIGKAAQHLADIVAKVRRYAKTQMSPHVPCDLKEIVGKAIRSFCFERSMQAEERFSVSFPSQACPILGDPMELEVLFVNLLRNAFDAMETFISQKKISPNSQITVKVQPLLEHKTWQISISNPGPAASAETIEHLNALSSPISSKPEGLGLGLSICRGIADSHGADLRFTANPTGGVTAIVCIDFNGK